MSTELARLDALSQENAVLVRELSRVQERVTRILAEKSAEITHLQIQIVTLRHRLAEAAHPLRKGSLFLSLIGLIPSSNERKQL